MGFIVGTVILLAATALSYILFRTAAKGSEGRLIFGIATPVLVIAICALTLFSSLVSVKSGFVGVVTSPGGKITGQITGNGYTMVAPWNNVETVSYKQQSYTYELNAFSSETQDVFVDATIQYRINPEDVVNLYTNVGRKWFDIVVLKRLQQFPKDETVKFSSVQIAPNREKIRSAIKNRLNTELARFGINVDDYLIDNIDFPKAFKQAITAKQVATQDALRSQQLVQKAKYEAESRVAEAQGIADATVIQAKADAKKNELISNSITSTLVEYTKAQALQNANTIYVPSQWQAYGNAPNTGK